MPRGRPKKVVVEEEVEPKLSITATLESIVEDEIKKAQPWDYLVPYKGKEELPHAKVDSKGKVKETFKRYYMSGRQLIAIYRGREGVIRRVSKHTFHMSKKKDKQIVKALAKKGIPGAELLK